MEVVTLKNRGDRRTTGPLNVLGPVYKKRGLPLCEGYLASGLNLALVYKQISQVALPYHLGQLYQLC